MAKRVTKFKMVSGGLPPSSTYVAGDVHYDGDPVADARNRGAHRSGGLVDSPTQPVGDPGPHGSSHTKSAPV